MNKYPLRSNVKNKWTPEETYHTVRTYIYLVENDVKALMKQPTKKTEV